MGKTKLTLSNINGDTLYATDIIGREWCKGINDGYWFSCDNLNYLSEEDVELIVKDSSLDNVVSSAVKL